MDFIEYLNQYNLPAKTRKSRAKEFWQPIHECYFCGRVIRNRNCEVEIPITEDGESIRKVFAHKDCVIQNCDKEWIEENL